MNQKTTWIAAPSLAMTLKNRLQRTALGFFWYCHSSTAIHVVVIVLIVGHRRCKYGIVVRYRIRQRHITHSLIYQTIFRSTLFYFSMPSLTVPRSDLCEDTLDCHALRLTMTDLILYFIVVIASARSNPRGSFSDLVSSRTPT